jgi:serine/threonine-protein kinase
MIAVGERIGPFHVTGTLGAGGMGQVYRARDSRLNREVAIKVLPPKFAADPESMARFSREAQLLAALSHPNIAVLYGLEETGGASALIMELVEGQTLAHRIAAGPLALDEAVAIARQIAEALEAAHDKGIVHRDLKPSNVKIDPQGKVKVLDFGLAKAVEPAPAAGVSPSESPTLVGDFTRTDVIMGTAAYMSPEQARGKTVDKRADIWAFGVLLYEMLTGRPMFLADTVAETLASVLRAEIDLTHLPIDTPPGIRRLIRRCLQRDPKQRLRDIGDARIELDAADDASPPAVLRGLAPARRSWLPWIAAGALAIVAGGFAVAPYYREQPQPAAAVRFLVSPPEKVAFGLWLAVSPDGRHIAFPGTSPDGVTRIWVRSLNSVDTRPIADAEAPGTITLFWSSDSRSVVFASAGKVKRIAIDGGPAQTLCDAPPVGRVLECQGHDSDGQQQRSDHARFRGRRIRFARNGGRKIQRRDVSLRPAVPSRRHALPVFPAFLQAG